MSECLTVAVAQPQSALGDVGANVAVHAAAVTEADARVVVFPELSLTGYSIEAEPIAPADARLAPIVAACEASGSIAFIGAPISGSDGAVFIAMLAIDAGGASVVYRKMWLGGDEPTRFTAGLEPSVVDVDGWRLGLAICRTRGPPNTPRRSRRWASTHTSAVSASRPMPTPNPTVGRASSPTGSVSGSRWRVSPGRRVAASTPRPAARACGVPTGRRPSSSTNDRDGSAAARSNAQTSTERLHHHADGPAVVGLAVADLDGIDQVIHYRIGPSIGAHTGPGTFGLFVSPTIR